MLSSRLRPIGLKLGMQKAWDSAAADRVLAAFLPTQDQLLPILHALQAEFGCVAAD
jgi:hypothetical protein